MAPYVILFAYFEASPTCVLCIACLLIGPGPRKHFQLYRKSPRADLGGINRQQNPGVEPKEALLTSCIYFKSLNFLSFISTFLGCLYYDITTFA